MIETEQTLICDSCSAAEPEADPYDDPAWFVLTLPDGPAHREVTTLHLCESCWLQVRGVIGEVDP